LVILVHLDQGGVKPRSPAKLPQPNAALRCTNGPHLCRPFFTV
jgi:hypothetical protein